MFVEDEKKNCEIMRQKGHVKKKVYNRLFLCEGAHWVVKMFCIALV